MRQQISKWLFNILLVAVSIALALGLLEGGARFLPTPFEGDSNPADTASKQTGWRGKPNYQTTAATDDYVHTLTLNSVGMHDSEHSRSKSDNTFRILMLGDSFVQAVQVREAETAHQVLEDMLNSQHTTQSFEVISAGVGGWGTGQQLLYYRYEGRSYQPDLVLLMFFLGNDVKDNLPGRGVTVAGLNHYTPYFVFDGQALDPEPWLYTPGLDPVLGQSTMGWKTVNNLLGRLYQSSRLYAQLEPLVAAEPVKASMIDFYTGNSRTFDYALELTFALVKQMQQEVTQGGAQFAVVLVSPIDLIEFSMMSPAEREAVYQRLPVLKRAEEITPPNEQIAARLTRDGIDVLDLLPSFTDYINRTQEMPHFKSDKHWTAAGNRLAGESIYNWLHENDKLVKY